MKQHFSLSVILVLLTAVWIQAAGQQFDYESYPTLDANYTHLDLELWVDQEPGLTGSASYELFLMRDEVAVLRLDAVRMEFDRILWDGEEVDFTMEDDRLMIPVPSDATTGTAYTLQIDYRAWPRFGVLHRGDTVWSSGKPRSVRHWLPIFDHPRNRLTTDVSLIVPVGKRAVFTGMPEEPEVETVDMHRIRFTSDREVPASSLRFAVGDFEVERLDVSRPQVFYYRESGSESGGASGGASGNDLVRGSGSESEPATSGEGRPDADRISELIETIENRLQADYPGRVLHLVQLKDDMWEYRHFGAGMVFGYEQPGNLESQFYTGILSQWAGVQWTQEQWQDSDALILKQAWLYRQLPFAEPLNPRIHAEGIEPDQSIYRLWHWNRRASWYQELENNPHQPLFQLLEQNAVWLFEDLPPVYNSYDFAARLYDRSGLALFELPEPAPADFPEVSDEPEEEEVLYRYRVEYDYNEAEQQLTLSFTALDRPIGELVTVRVDEIRFDGIETREISFTGDRDEWVLNVGRGLENLNLRLAEELPVAFKLEKPFEFWTHQLRNDEDPTRRAEAAKGLADHAGNPDLQLLLLDLIDREEEPEVTAEMIRTLGVVTGGASGTDRIFLQRYEEDLHPVVQKAFYESFENYPGNEPVIQLLRRASLQATGDETRMRAVKALSEVADENRFRSILESILQDDSMDPIAHDILRLLADRGETESLIHLAGFYLDERFSYDRRSRTLDLLLEYDGDANEWRRRIETYLNDPDPRIRYRILDGLQFLDASDREQIIDERRYEEYDARVLNKLNVQ